MRPRVSCKQPCGRGQVCNLIVSLVQVSETAFDVLSCDWSILLAPTVSSVHTPRDARTSAAHTTLAEDIAPISGSKQPARVLRGPEAQSPRRAEAGSLSSSRRRAAGHLRVDGNGGM